MQQVVRGFPGVKYQIQKYIMSRIIVFFAVGYLGFFSSVFFFFPPSSRSLISDSVSLKKLYTVGAMGRHNTVPSRS